MITLINITETQVRQVKPLSECYFIINRETLQILETNIVENCLLYEMFPMTQTTESNTKNKTNTYEFFDSLIKNIVNELKINLEVASSLEIQFNNQSTIEVKFYPTGNNIIFFIKDKTKHIQVSDIIEKNDQKLSILMEISKGMMQFNEPKEMLDTLFERLSSLLDLDYYFNYLIDSPKEQIRLMNYHGISKETAKSIEYLQFGEAVCGTVAQLRERIIAENIDSSSDSKVQLIKGWNIKAYICHPLFAHGKFIGTLSFGSSKRSTFSQIEIELIGQICNQIAKSLERIFLITNLKEVNIALTSTNKQLLIEKERADKANKAKINFLLLMSHEFRTPLNSIMGYNQLLLTSPNSHLSNKEKVQLEKMLNAGEQLKKMMNDMLDFVRYDNVSLTFDLKSVDMSNLIDECIDEVNYFAKSKKVSIEFENLVNNIEIYTDPKRLKQVVNNILINAIKYNKKNGKIRIITNIDNTLNVEFHDTGTGIEVDELDEIFKPFYRSPSNPPSIEGSGIGLSLSRQIINELGGNLTVTSQKDVGSSFKIQLPLILT